EFAVSVSADGIEANRPDQTFKIFGDLDPPALPATIAAACGGAGTALGAAHSVAGALCEDFDTNRAAPAGIQWTRPCGPAGADPLFCPPAAPADDILGQAQNGGGTPGGVSGQMCSTDAGFPAARATCRPIASENDWHLHSTTTDCDAVYDPG